MSNDPDRTDASQISTDREAIRAWADEHDATPYRHPDEEEYRLGRSDEIGESHERADWDDFHSHLDENDRVVIYHGEGAGEPFEVAHRDEAMSRSNVSSDELEERLMEGETVTSTVTETAVVEEVIVEEATIESELVDTEITNESVVDVELLSRECSDCQLEDTGTIDANEWFDEDRYLASAGRPDASARTGGTMDRTGGVTGPDRTTDDEVTATEPMGTEHTESEQGTVDTMETEPTTAERGGADTMEGAPRDTDLTDTTYSDVEEEYPYTAHMEVEEAWAVTRELTERYTVESRVSDVDVAETDSIEDHDIDVDGLQRNLAESDLFDFDLSADELLEEHEIETEIAEDDRIHTYFTRSQVVEDEVVDRRTVQAEITGVGDLRDFERVETTDLATDETAMGEGTALGDADDDTAVADTDTDDAVMDDSTAQRIATGEEVETDSDDVPLSQDEIGKDVIDSTGETIGMVTDVSEDGTTMFVDPHPGITQKIKAALDWGDASDDDMPVEIEQIDHVTRDEITLKGAEELDEITSPTA